MNTPADRIPKWDKEQRPQLLWVESLLLVESNSFCIKLDRWFADPLTTASLSTNFFKLMQGLELDRFREERLSRLSERSRLI